MTDNSALCVVRLAAFLSLTSSVAIIKGHTESHTTFFHFATLVLDLDLISFFPRIEEVLDKKLTVDIISFVKQYVPSKIRVCKAILCVLNKRVCMWMKNNPVTV